MFIIDGLLNNRTQNEPCSDNVYCSNNYGLPTYFINNKSYYATYELWWGGGWREFCTRRPN